MIRICDKCDGRGEVYERTGLRESEYVECGNCKGSGRIVVLRFKTELPYGGIDGSVVTEYSNKIRTLIAELEKEVL